MMQLDILPNPYPDSLNIHSGRLAELLLVFEAADVVAAS